MQISPDQFREALATGTSAIEKLMLRAHYFSANHTVSRSLLAFIAGCSENGVNGVYGALAKRTAERFGYSRPADDYTWTSFLGKCSDGPDGQTYLWEMHPSLVEAIEALEWNKLP